MHPLQTRNTFELKRSEVNQRLNKSIEHQIKPKLIECHSFKYIPFSCDQRIWHNSQHMFTLMNISYQFLVCFVYKIQKFAYLSKFINSFIVCHLSNLDIASQMRWWNVYLNAVETITIWREIVFNSIWSFRFKSIKLLKETLKQNANNILTDVFI